MSTALLARVPQGQGPGQTSPNAVSSADAFAALEWPGDVRDAATSSWLWFAVVGGLVVLAVLWWQRRAIAAPARQMDRRPEPRALLLLRGLSLPSHGALVAAFYGQLKGLLRLHCEERFALRAMVATSEEIVRALPEQDALSRQLAACDAVLFAAVEPKAAAHAVTLQAAIDYVAATTRAVA